MEAKYEKLVNVFPCPFCGSDDIYIKSEYEDHLFTVYCHNCFIKQSGSVDRGKAINDWNRRSTS